MSVDLMRGDVAWHMQLEDVILGHVLGFDYPMRGSRRPESRNIRQEES